MQKRLTSRTYNHYKKLISTNEHILLHRGIITWLIKLKRALHYDQILGRNNKNAIFK